jgi:hypothetical protein
METQNLDTTEQRREAMMQKVAKLMDKAAGAKEIGNLQEAEAFTMGVQRLMQEYNLTEWEIQKNRPEVKSAFTIENTVAERISYDDYGKKGRPGGHWPLDLWIMLTRNFMCSAVYWKKSKIIALFGTKENLATVKYMYSYLDNLFPQMALVAWREQTEIDNRYQYMRNWIDGAIAGLGQKLDNERYQREYTNNSEKGLMIFNKEALQKAQEEAVGKSKTRNRAQKQTTSATIAGYKVGISLEINKGLEEGVKVPQAKRLN